MELRAHRNPLHRSIETQKALFVFGQFDRGLAELSADHRGEFIQGLLLFIDGLQLRIPHRLPYVLGHVERPCFNFIFVSIEVLELPKFSFDFHL